MIALGTKVIFTRDIWDEANEDHPAILHARKGDTGTTIECRSNFWDYKVQTDHEILVMEGEIAPA